MDFYTFERSISKSRVFPIYIVFGEETFLIRRALLLIKDKILKDVNVDLSLSEFEGKGVAFGQILDELYTIPFFGTENRRLIIIKGADDFLSKYKKKLKEYLLAPSSYASLLLVCNKYNNEVDSQKGDKDIIVMVECKKLRDYQLPSWILSRVKTYKKKITTRAAQILAEETGNNLELLENNIEKLSIYLGERTAIEEKDVRELIHGGRRQTIFELTNAVAAKNTARALKILDRLIVLGEESTRIISLLGWQLKRIWMAKRIIKNCGDNRSNITKQIQNELKVPPFFCKEFLTQVDLFTDEALEYKYSLLTEADVETKTGPLDPNMVMECLIVKLCK